MNINETQKWNHGFIGHALAVYEEEQLINLKSMEKYRGVIEDPAYRDVSPTHYERVLIANQTGLYFEEAS